MRGARLNGISATTTAAIDVAYRSRRSQRSSVSLYVRIAGIYGSGRGSLSPQRLVKPSFQGSVQGHWLTNVALSPPRGRVFCCLYKSLVGRGKHPQKYIYTRFAMLTSLQNVARILFMQFSAAIIEKSIFHYISANIANN